MLEEVALDAVAEDGRLVSRTSARQVAQHLGIDPGGADRALRILRRRKLLRSVSDRSSAERFGLSVYLLDPVAGLRVLEAPGSGSSALAAGSDLGTPGPRPLPSSLLVPVEAAVEPRRGS